MVALFGKKCHRMSTSHRDIHVVYRSSKRVTLKQLDRLEAEFGAALPLGYRDFLTHLGHGWINDWLQLYCPNRDLMMEQRNSLVERFEQYSCDQLMRFDGAELKMDDIGSSIQIGIDQDDMQLFACPRFPGTVFDWSGFTITQHESGVERLDPFAGMRMGTFAYFIPLQPVPEYRSFACQSKRLPVEDVVRTFEVLCKGGVHVIDVDEGPGQGARTPAFWIFPKKLGVKLHVYGVETSRHRRIYLTIGTSPKLLPKVESLIASVMNELRVNFKPAKWY